MREKQKNHGIRRDAGKAPTTCARKVRLVDCLLLVLPSSWMRGFKDVNLGGNKNSESNVGVDREVG